MESLACSDAIQCQSHALLKVPRNPRHNQQRTGIDQHEIEHRLQRLRDVRAGSEQCLERLRVLLRRAPRDVRKRVRRQAEVGRVDRALGDRAVLEVPDVRRACAADLIELLRAADDERAHHAACGDALRVRVPELGLRDADDHAARARGVDDRAEDVEHRAEGQRFAVRRDERHRGVVVGREDERERYARDGHRRVGCRRGEEAAEGLQQVGGA